MSETSIPLQEIAKGLNELSFNILSQLNKVERLRYSEVRKKFDLAQAKANIELSRLEGARLISKERDMSDARAIYYTITDYGRQVLKFNRD